MIIFCPKCGSPAVETYDKVVVPDKKSIAIFKESYPTKEVYIKQYMCSHGCGYIDFTNKTVEDSVYRLLDMAVRFKSDANE